MCVCVCVCVCDRERERERVYIFTSVWVCATHTPLILFFNLLFYLLLLLLLSLLLMPPPVPFPHSIHLLPSLIDQHSSSSAAHIFFHHSPSLTPLPHSSPTLVSGILQKFFQHPFYDCAWQRFKVYISSVTRFHRIFPFLFFSPIPIFFFFFFFFWLWQANDQGLLKVAN